MTDSVPVALTTPRPRRRLWQGILVGCLAVLVAIAALPNYVSGTWPWSAPLEVPRINQIQRLMDNPLSLPGWTLMNDEKVNIGRSRWHLAEYQPAQPTTPEIPGIVLLMRPQPWHTNQPEVEWVDLRGSQKWRVDNSRTFSFQVPKPGHGGSTENRATVTVNYFRGISDQRTFAVMQWYSWPQGGHPAPGRWFWLDQIRQWQHNQRQPWIAVSLLLPIEPVGDARLYEDLAREIGTTVQTALMAGPFEGMEES
ncbi:cyanoexosortase B system-associated protein [Leptolyngbya sp. PCC 6406]|uniref:cyanoexosortase B system-associated protein n=1 Tax=Leptolyngbya sp. PCC 6406 TaxID=1173264 RepID=UPI0002AC81C6|nr:cyanoexosortase B system-associated protein [Leptolyngbya sp. PCC 6406]